jgi:hypothetical protein
MYIIITKQTLWYIFTLTFWHHFHTLILQQLRYRDRHFFCFHQFRNEISSKHEHRDTKTSCLVTVAIQYVASSNLETIIKSVSSLKININIEILQILQSQFTNFNFYSIVPT